MFRNFYGAESQVSKNDYTYKTRPCHKVHKHKFLILIQAHLYVEHTHTHTLSLSLTALNRANIKCSRVYIILTKAQLLHICRTKQT